MGLVYTHVEHTFDFFPAHTKICEGGGDVGSRRFLVILAILAPFLQLKPLAHPKIGKNVKFSHRAAITTQQRPQGEAPHFCWW